jgi:hypothetical protein
MSELDLADKLLRRSSWAFAHNQEVVGVPPEALCLKMNLGQVYDKVSELQVTTGNSETQIGALQSDLATHDAAVRLLLGRQQFRAAGGP